MDGTLSQNIIKDLGLDTLPPERQMQVLLGIGRVIQQNIILRVLELLPEEAKDEFDKLLAEKMNDEEAVLGFLRSKIPNLDQIVEEEISKFKEESAELLKSVQESTTA